MRSLPGLAAALAVAVSACGKLPPVMPYEPAKAEAQIREIEQSWAQVAVSGDPAVIEKIFADDFAGIAPDGTPYGKRDFIEDTKANPLGFRSITLDDMKVRFIGNVAIAQGHETFIRRDGEKGRFVWTDVLERRKGTWVVVAAQDVVAAPGERAAGTALFPSGGAPEAAEAATAHPAVKELDRTRNDYVEAWKAADAGRITGLYTDDGVVMVPDRPPVVGRPAIADHFEGFFTQFDALDFQLASSEIVVTGDWAFDRGTYRWTTKPKKGGAPRNEGGTYLVILRRESDGRWRVARDMATRGTP